ncbi:MAG: AAA domain-containing protein [Bacteroidales bacterium]|jgi:superfamily I DNA and/or RNA helicase|nr:AAA domain-containing protein [Bacteroidales bacterium]
MELTEKLLTELQRRLKVGNRRGVHLNAIPAKSRYKFDLNRLFYIDKNLPNNFINSLLTEQPLKFRISWKDNVPDLNSLFQEDQAQLVRITKAFENLINQTEAIESEKGINTFGFGFPILVRRDQSDNKLTVAPILIWSLRIKRTKEFNTWEINRNEEDPIYLNEVLINHIQNDSHIEIAQIPSEMLDDGLINKNELIEICINLIKAINTSPPSDLEETLKKKLDNIISIGDKTHYEKLPVNSTNSFIDFGGLFSIFEVQKQNIINDYGNLLDIEGLSIDLENLVEHTFQPISSVETDPSQQSILNSLEATRNILIQGPPGTGKSQTLTAILINALENQKKTIVVCEKRTALEVLHNALIEKNLNYHCVLIRDIVKDRKTVVDSVRERVDNSEYRQYRYSYSKETLDNLITTSKGLIDSINNKHKKLDEKLLGNKSWTDIVGLLLTELKGTKEQHNLNLDKNHFNYSSQELNSTIDLVQKGQSLYTDFYSFETLSFINSEKLIGNNPFIIEKSLNDDFKFYQNEVESIKTLFGEVNNEHKLFRKSELKEQIIKINKSIEKIGRKNEELKESLLYYQDKYCQFRSSELSYQINIVNKYKNEIENIFSLYNNKSDLFNENKIIGFAYRTLSKFSKSKKKVISDYKKLQLLFTQVENEISNAKDFENISFLGQLENKKNALMCFISTINDVISNFNRKICQEYGDFHLDKVIEYEKIQEGTKHLDKVLNEANNISNNFSEILNNIKNGISAQFDDINNYFNELNTLLKNCKDFNDDLNFQGTLKSKISTLPKLEANIESVKSIFESKVYSEFEKIELLSFPTNDFSIPHLADLQTKVKELINRINTDNWTKRKSNTKSLRCFLSDVADLIIEKESYFANENDLFTIEFKWFQFFNDLSQENKILINELKNKTNWRKTLLIHYLNSMLVNSANIDLPTNDNEHSELNSTLSGIEKEQVNYIKEFWFSKQIDATREFDLRNVNLSVSNLYNKRSSSRLKRVSLRQIVKFDANLFTTFFPIILTSPDVCCNLFKGMNGYFDIVMFDEASQLRLEDNLPAILKGRQIVIAGDEHQMPPSNYFSSIFEGTTEDVDDMDEEETSEKSYLDIDDILLSCESLLEFATELNFKKKYLDFHYRSRHPFLIDFSNYAFYNQRLKPLPNNLDYVPIKYIPINGTFSEYTNEAEAEMVLSILGNNINRLTDGNFPTVGIATFNIAQRNLIKSKILERLKFSKYEEFNLKIQELEANGMFIKNLENIQGDEKDVIILSTTYGIGKDGKFAQRFGPINHSKGYKLLNVIITRAKYKIYVCSSVPEQVFMNYKEHLSGERSNNKRAVFYAYLAYCKAVSEENNDLRLSVLTALSENSSTNTNIDSFRSDLESPFEEEVYHSLVANFEEDNLIPQMQFAGFRIDIVYDSKIIGVPKIAIECDGAKYHSSQEAYLYDRHRQKILENHGFVFHRIWSTNWWRNPIRETARLVHFIKDTVTTTKNKGIIDRPSFSSAFSDEFETIVNYVSQSSSFDEELEIETVNVIESVSPVQIRLFNDEIKLKSTVKVKYVNNGKDTKIQIVESTNNKIESINGVQKINIKSPLATSILGHTIGDIVKVGNLDNYVEILEVAN